MGWVTRLGKRKAAHYELSERFFNVWYLMRRSSRRQRKDLLWLTRFLQAWFSKNELAKRAQAYAISLERAYHAHELAYGIALAKALPGRKEGDELLVKVYDRLHQLYEREPQKN
ncbi:hypothetical protein BWI97_26190 [Siphonobacter sp. BAB-5405]|uniref:hypothetical protein n=1 Tax=Siphonobacter sp. BAB-5405 TaxID=1864825 RepID=UPI000C807331|nr:hypothetical protein [Siphonobacter sp. BAB-5405]PMD86652.1 hypothetical protein BWI97_26190 [Siphonobacter sp. BAB-5405]